MYNLNDWVLDVIDACHLNLAWDVCCLLRWSNGASLNFRDSNKTVITLSLSGATSRDFEIVGVSWGKACDLRDKLKAKGLIQ